MAAPVASGSSARQTPAANNGTAVAPTAMPTPTTAAATPVRAAANASQRGCWRSTPRAWRKRATSDPAPATRPATMTTKPTTMVTSTAPASAGMATGSTADWWGGITRPGPTVRASQPTGWRGRRPARTAPTVAATPMASR